ncbi:MAG TPA: hypothetical protein VFP44_12200 [Usitatibacter sp.]|nr:hypothetical protein [Usitatibacter sp.]
MKTIAPLLEQLDDLPASILPLIGRYTALREAIDQLTDGYVALGAQARVLDRNGAADALLSGCRRHVTIEHGRLVAHTAEVRRALATVAGGHPSNHGNGGRAPKPLVVEAKTGSRVTVMQFQALARRTERLTNHQPHALMWIIDTEPHAAEIARLREIFELTPTEARVAEALACGKTLTASARDLGMPRATAKSHLDAVFSKTGSRRQAQLVRLMACLRRLK